MAESSILWAQNQFSCSVCLDLLKDPVTIPCGHSYCMSCITDCWNQDEQRRVYSCPQCRQTFTPRPALGKNTMLAEVVKKVKMAEVQKVDPAPSYAGPGDVECDVCTGIKYKAIKSCLVCLESYCQTHLERHEEFHSGKRHKITDATGRIQEMICPKHDKLLEVYCRTDQKSICLLCTMDEHKNHDTVSTTSQRIEMQKHLEESQRNLQQKIQERGKVVQELKDAVETHKSSAQKAVKESDRIFTELIQFIKRRRSEVTQMIRDLEKTEVSRAEGLLEKLEQEIEDLKRRNTELQEILNTDDHIYFLKSLQSFSLPLESSDKPVTSLLLFDDIAESLTHLKEHLEDLCKEEVKNISDGALITSFEPRTREEFLQYFCQLTLDPNTVNKHIYLSEGNTAATYQDRELQYPTHPDRYDQFSQVLCKECVRECCYWEVEWNRKAGAYISVSYKSICRKGGGFECGFGYNDQSWSLFSSNCSCLFLHNKVKTELPIASSTSKIGVYVNHSAGILSFFSVSDTTMSLIHRVQTTFTQPLYPGFWLYKSNVKLCHQ